MPGELRGCPFLFGFFISKGFFFAVLRWWLVFSCFSSGLSLGLWTFLPLSFLVFLFILTHGTYYDFFFKKNSGLCHTMPLKCCFLKVPVKKTPNRRRNKQPQKQISCFLCCFWSWAFPLQPQPSNFSLPPEKLCQEELQRLFGRRWKILGMTTNRWHFQGSNLSISTFVSTVDFQKPLLESQAPYRGSRRQRWLDIWLCLFLGGFWPLEGQAIFLCMIWDLSQGANYLKPPSSPHKRHISNPFWTKSLSNIDAECSTMWCPEHPAWLQVHRSSLNSFWTKSGKPGKHLQCASNT